MNTPNRRARIRSGVAALAVATLLSVSVPTAALADPIVPHISGTVTLDTNANGVVDANTANGFVEAAMAGVQIDVVCVATGTSILSTTSDAAGAWSFASFDLGAGALNCPDGVVRVKSTVIDDRYSITDATGDNQTPRTANEQVGLSAPITLSDSSNEVVNTLTRPDWYLNLTIPIDAGTGGPAVYTGSGPFDTVCPEPGHDCAIDDNTVRSADTVTYTWAVTGSSLDDLAPTAGAVILEQTLTLTDGAIANFSRIPARCKPAGGGGTVPVSVIVDQNGAVIPEGAMPPAGTTSVTLRCNLGVWSHTGDAVTLQPVVKISAESPNGSSFTSTASAYAVDANNVPTAVPASPASHGPVDITAAPAYELDKKGFFNLDVATRDIGNGPELGYITYAVIQVKTNRSVGVEALQQPITVTEDLFGIAANGVSALPGMQFAITQCIPNPTTWSGTVGGKAAPYGGFTNLDQTVIDSGTCAYARNSPALTSDYTLTFSGIDMSGARYPTRNAGGSDLSAGPFYVASYRVQIFIPKSTIDAADGVPGDNAGSFQLYNRVGGFDPNGVSVGSNNFGSGVEPGYCDSTSVDGQALNAAGMPHCDTMAGGGRSDNVIGPLAITFGYVGFSKYILNTKTLYLPDWSPATGVTGLTSPHAGNGTGEPGQVYESYLDYVNNSLTPLVDSRICDVFDNTIYSLASSAEGMTSGGSASIYAVLAASGLPSGTTVQAYNSKWIFEYGHIAITGDDPISGGTPDPTTGRIPGTWTDQASKKCADTDAVGGWQTDPNAVPGGIDEVNAVRVRPGIDPATGAQTLHPVGADNRLIFSMKIRARFYGGPHSGAVIPEATVAANYGHVRTSSLNGGNWYGGSYKPSPENTAGDGDRITITHASLAIQKRTITVDGIGDGAANFGATGAAVAAHSIVWEIVSAVTSVSTTPAAVADLTITDVLPAFDDYDPDCTASIAGGTPADEVLYNTPSAGRTTLIWHLGSWMPNTDIPNRRICTNSDPLAPNGTSLVNHSAITFDGSVNDPTDDHTVILEQTGEVKLRKAVDAPIDVLNDDQHYTLSMQNFSQTLTVGAPTLIEVFPYNGDATPPGGVNRSPASHFTGALKLTAPATVTNVTGGAYSGQFFYTTDAPATVNQDLNLNTSTWLTAAALAGDFSQVTAIKFVGASNLTPSTARATSGLTVSFTLQAGDSADPFSTSANAAADQYSDRFTAFSSTFTGANGYQVLASNRTTVRTVSHSSGDLVFEDRDGDGVYTAGRDLLAPDGVTVNLYYESTGGDVLVGSTTTSGGLYLFTKLPAGRYHVEIPASEFASGALLDGYSLTVAPAAGSGEATIDQNDDVSHDAIAGPGNSIISNSFVLSATVNPTTGAVSGDEPTGENSHGITDASSTDPFSNLAIDLAVQRAPGIDIEKEVCTLADNACDPAAELAVGGWSADAVAGVGPTTETAQRPYGSAVLWRITVTNTGNQYLADVSVADAVTTDCAADATGVPSFADFAPAASESYTCETGAITENITPNTASVVGTPAGGDPVADSDTANATTTGSLVINKLVTGPGTEEFGVGPFVFTVVCTLDSVEVLNHEVTLTPTAGASAVTSDPISGLPLGASCTVTETDAAGADAIPAPVELTIVNNDQQNTVIAEVSNHFSQATLEVSKNLDGSAADTDYVESLQFEIMVTCQVQSTDDAGTTIVATVYSGSVTLRGGETVTILDGDGDPLLLPIGAHCFAEETDDGGAVLSTVNFDSWENAAIVGSSDESQVLSLTVTNGFDQAAIVVRKLVVGPGSAGPYTFTLDCELANGEPFELEPADAEFTLSMGQSRTIHVLVGVTCTVAETNLPAGARMTIVDTDDGTEGGSTDGAVVVSPDGEAVTVTNTYLPTVISADHSLAFTGIDVRTNLMFGAAIVAGAMAVGFLLVLIGRRRRRVEDAQ